MLVFNGATLSDIHTFRLVGSNNLLIYSSAGIKNGEVQHGVVIQDFYSGSYSTNIERLQDGKGNVMLLSQMSTPEDAAYSDPSVFDLVA